LQLKILLIFRENMNENEKKEVHGNDKRSTKPQHVYQIFDWFFKIVFKYGISGSQLNKDGSSTRANSQVNQKNKDENEIRYSAEVLQTNIENREKALEIEKQLVAAFKKEHKDNPSGNLRPIIPDEELQTSQET